MSQKSSVPQAVSFVSQVLKRDSVLPEGYNPSRRIEKFKEHRRERFLTAVELERLGAAIRQAETVGLPWNVDERPPNAKHLAKSDRRFAKIGPFAAAALRLLLFTGCRLREILHLRWEYVDLERGLIFLPDSKSGRKTIILNAPALAVLGELDRVGPYVVPGDDPQKPRADLKRPWAAVAKSAGLDGVRLHDLRHTYASFGAGGGFGLPISASCSATHRRPPPNAMRILMPTHCGAHPTRSAVALQRHWRESAVNW
jgi:integrase